MNNPVTGKPLLWLVAIAFFMQTLDGTIVNTALPSMAKALGESPLQMQSVIEAYLLTIAILIPASGWLSDRFGTRSIFMFALTMFAIGSLCCAQSQTLNQLIISRVIQGIGGSLMLPVGRLTILRTIPREQFLAAMSFVVMPGLLGPIIGPALGGFLVEIANWHWVFLINLPVAVIGLWTAYKVMPDIRSPHQEKFDYLGFILLAGAMATFTIGLDLLAHYKTGHYHSLYCLATGVILIALYWWLASVKSNPLFSPRLFGVSTFAIGAFANLFYRMGSGAMPLLIPLYLQLALGLSPFTSGLAMIPIALFAIIAKSYVVRLIHHYGYRNVLRTASCLQFLCFCSFTLTNHSLVLILVQLAILGSLNSITYSGIGTISLRDLSDQQASSGNGLLSVIQQLGFSLGVACGATLLAIFYKISPNHNMLWSFNWSFTILGLIVLIPAFLYCLLPNDAPKRQSKKQMI
ncbi:multidrug transporter subunit MdtD [Celerinatantimonas diazotrophica]|uniref:EmrB/QacA subfamily drug resistance transporter n=1 Tax=Celerinatantimonas diazotrophica TaxID=412034 RepID=A0A4R1J8Z8_9GAMM|nr:multidrug transporter subunit MdtD [Celerinatantimonas diazotrophica]TCK47083.1 EmrB/QacA subfamily drug resistance transporter [Celerinatantimonas diazotrophica]CAG9295852.1 putative transport protein HsrA [Celerinatantimonas diazotrophica]